MQTGRWLHLLSSLLGIPLRCDLFRKRIDQKKFPFIETNNWIVLAVQWSVKHFLLQISRYSGKVVEKRRTEAITRRFDFQVNGMIWLCICIFVHLHLALGLVTHNDIPKIYIIIQYFKNIFKCNMVKNILEI